MFSNPERLLFPDLIFEFLNQLSFYVLPFLTIFSLNGYKLKKIALYIGNAFQIDKYLFLNLKTLLTG